MSIETLRTLVTNARSEYRYLSEKWITTHGPERARNWKARKDAQARYFSLQRALFKAEAGAHIFHKVEGSPDEWCLCGTSRGEHGLVES